jgi:hypothetical protein
LCLIKFLKLRLCKNNRAANLSNNRGYEVVYFFQKCSNESKLQCAKMSDSEENLPSDIELAAQSAIDILIPAKSKERYEIV